MELKQVYIYDNACYQMLQLDRIRFAGIINKHGRKIAGGFNPKITPLENDAKKIEMLMMELALDLSMRKEFDGSLGGIRAIVSYREKVNVITIPHGECFMLLSSEPEFDTQQIIHIAHQYLSPIEVLVQ